MTDHDDPFGDISESLAQESDDDDGDTAEGATPEETQTTERPTSGTGQSTTTRSSSGGEETQSSADSIDQPAFKFDEAEQFAWYALPDVRDEYEEVRDFEVKRLLRDRGFSDVPQSELTNAALAVLAEHPEAWADKVEEIRQESG